MLVLFSASGLLAGVLTRQVASVLRTSTGSTSTLAPVDLTATAGAVTPASPSAFVLQVATSPASAKAGQTVQVAVTALGKTASTPMSGIHCSLVSTTDS